MKQKFNFLVAFFCLFLFFSTIIPAATIPRVNFTLTLPRTNDSTGTTCNQHHYRQPAWYDTMASTKYVIATFYPTPWGLDTGWISGKRGATVFVSIPIRPTGDTLKDFNRRLVKVRSYTTRGGYSCKDTAIWVRPY